MFVDADTNKNLLDAPVSMKSCSEVVKFTGMIDTKVTV